MSTSLAQQLQNLQTPQTAQSSVTRKVSSILFDTHTAEELTLDKAFDLGTQGIRDLQILNPRFREFDDFLFKESSKGIQRAVQHNDFNERLDQQINKFLVMVSPHLLLKPALQALEWLVHRFQIGEYNTNELVMCALPFHNTPTFCLVLRAIPEIRKENSTWHWLKPILDSGVPLDILTVQKRVANQVFILRMIVQHTISAYKDCAMGDFGRLQTLFSFTTSMLLGVLVLKRDKLSHTELACMVPFIHTGLSSTSAALLAGSLAVVSHLAATSPLADTLAQEIITHLTLVKLDALRKESISVLVLFFTAQSRVLGHSPKISEFVVTRLASMEKFPGLLAQIQSKNQSLNLTPFLMPLLETSLDECMQDKQFFVKGVDKMIVKLLENVTLMSDQAASIIKFFLKHLPEEMSNSERGWYSSLFRMLESRYPAVLDSETRKIFAKDSALKDSYHLILTHEGLEAEDGIMTVNGLCHQMLHPEESIRASAIRTASKMLKNASEENKLMLHSCLKDRLKDESMAVVCAVLNMKQFLKVISTKDNPLEVLLELLEHAQHTNWNAKALAYLLAHVGNSITSKLTEEKELMTILHVLPHIIANPSTFKVFVETKICANSPILKDLRTRASSPSGEKVPENVVLLGAVQDVFRKSKLYALKVVESRLESTSLTAMDLYLLCLILQGVSYQVVMAHHRMQCCTLAMAIKERAKVSFPKKPLYPPESKTQYLANHYNEIVRDNTLPINAFTEIMVAIVRKPLRPFMAQAVRSIRKSVAILAPDISDAESSSEASAPSSPNFKWRKLFQDKSTESEEDMYLKLSFTIMSILLELYPKFEQVDEEQPHMRALRTFIMMNFNTLEEQLQFLSQMWSQPKMQMEDRIRAVMFATSILKMHPKPVSDILQLDAENCFVPSLLCVLSHPEMYLRQVAVKLLREVAVVWPKDSNNSYRSLISHLASQADEISQHEDQLGVALYSVLTQEESVRSMFVKSEVKLMDKARVCLFSHCVSPSTPKLVVASLLKCLSYVKSQECLKMLVPLADYYLSMKTVAIEKHDFDIVSQILTRIDVSTGQEFLSSEVGWKCYQDCLLSNLSCGNEAVANVAVSIVDKELFNSINSELKANLLHLLLTADNDQFNTRSLVAALLRKLPLDGQLVASELKKMVGENDKKITQSRRSTRLGAVSTGAAAAKVTGVLGWTQGIALLESLPEKKKMEDAHLVVPVLFEILKVGLQSEDDQEYVKQLALSSLNTLLTLSQSKGVKCQVDIELIVSSLKTTTNPRTQRETLILLCHTAHLVPSKLMHHLVSVFTFMGTLVLRHDDEYSLQIIAQVIDDVVPVILSNDKGMAGLTNILRVFTDALPDIPSHRRPLVFEHLMKTVGWKHLWLLLVLVIESDAYGTHVTKKVDCILDLIKTASMPVLLNMLHNMFQYLSVFTEIEYGAEKQVTNAVDVKMKLNKFSQAILVDPCSKPASEVKKFQISALDFLSKLLSIKPSDKEGLRPTEKLSKDLEILYEKLMDCLMGYLLMLSQKEASFKSKFWSFMLLQGYSVLNKINMLLPLTQFVSVVKGVLTNTNALDSVKNKTLELLGAKLQLSKASDSSLQELVPLVEVCQDLAFGGEPNIACKALFCLRLLIGLLGSDGLQSHQQQLNSLLDGLLKLSHNLLDETNHSMMANVLLCLAELATVLKLKILGSLQKLVPTLLKASSNARKEGDDRSEIVMLASLAAIQRLLENLPQFMSSFLQPILDDVSQVAVISTEDLTPKAYSSIQYRVKKIQALLSSSITLRVLLTPVAETYESLSGNPDTLLCVGPLMNVLKARFDNMQSSEVPHFMSDLATFFLNALELRSNWDTKKSKFKDLDEDVMSSAEQEVISALVTFVLKLQEPVFKPFFYKLYKWSKDAEHDFAHRSRCITFFRIITSFADKLKGLFTVFVPIYVKQAAHLLQMCHQSSTEEFFGADGQAQQLTLLHWVMQSLLQVFTHDRQRFVKQETFDLLMQPLVDQLENPLGGEEAMVERGQNLVGPCLAQFARCMQDDVLWKQLHYQILLKTRSNQPKVRLVTIEAIQALAEVLREDLLPLLPEAIPFIAELMEDEDPEVEKKTQHVSRELEKILGEPLDKYF